MKLTIARVKITGPVILSMLVCAVIFCGAPAHAAELRDYRITVDAQEFDSILTHVDEDIYIPCSFEYNDELWTDARIRLRGESSREYPKKSFKINFDGDNRFFLRDKVNLISCWTDASFIREHLAYDLFHRAGLPASRNWFVRFYVNDVYMGLYLDVEQIDEHFLDYTDLPDDATLYKADLTGSLLAEEDLESFWEKETNTDSGYEDLAQIRDSVNLVTTELFDEWLAANFIPEQIARVIVVNALLANQSTYYHNYYLMHDHSGSGRWQYLPWDMDKTFYYWDEFRGPPYYRCGHQIIEIPNPLIEKSWLNDEMYDLIREQLVNVCDSLITAEYYQGYISELRELLSDAVDEDTMKQFETADFIYDTDNLANYLLARRDALLAQFESPLRPFSLEPELRDSEKFFLGWTQASDTVSSDIDYQLWVSEDVVFTDPQLYTITDRDYVEFSDEVTSDLFWRVTAVTGDGESIQSIRYYSILENDFELVDGTIVAPEIAANRTFDRAGSPFVLPRGLNIPWGISAGVEPGVRLSLGEQQSIKVSGTLQMNGAAGDSIVIEPAEGAGRWGAIHYQAAEDTVRWNFVSLVGGGFDAASWIVANGRPLDLRNVRMAVPSYAHGGILSNDSYLKLADCSFEVLPPEEYIANITQDIVTLHGGVADISDCYFENSGNQLATDFVDCNDIDSVWISGCEFRNSPDDIIDVDNALLARISRCIISGATDNAISMESAGSVYLQNILFSDCGTGVFPKLQTDVTAFNCVFEHCGDAVRFDTDRPPEAVRVYNSIFWQNERVAAANGLEDRLAISYCAAPTNVLPETNGNVISGLLGFADPDSKDFRLTAGSPLIDAGWGTGCPDTDFRGGSRVDDPDTENRGSGDITYVDIGMFEYLAEIDTLQPPAIPSSHLLVRNYPNPFNSSTRIQLRIPDEGRGTITIYNRLGRLVYSRQLPVMMPGFHELVWDGRDQQGRAVASGLYFVSLEHNGGRTQSKMILLR